MSKEQALLFPELPAHESETGGNGELRGKRSKVRAYVSSIWSFPDAGGERLYRWYGTLPRALVSRLLDLYASRQGTRVLDPFMGVGTTLDIAAGCGIPALGIDSHPLACLVTEARLAGRPPLSKVSVALDAIEHSFEDALTFGRSEQRALLELIDSTQYAYTRKWIRRDSLKALLALLWLVSQVKEIRLQRLLFVAASQVVRALASVDPRCTHHLVTKKKPFIHPVQSFRQAVLDGLQFLRAEPADLSLIKVRQGSVLDSDFEGRQWEFVVAHPPYLGVIHYHLIHRLATDLLDVIKRTISPPSLSTYVFNHEALKQWDVSTDDSARYAGFVEHLADRMSKAVRTNGRCLVIIGDQRYRGHIRHPMTDFVKWFERKGFLLEENFIWVLQNNSGMHVLRRGHFIDHNYILVFHRTS